MIVWGPPPDAPHTCDRHTTTTYANGDTLVSCADCGRDLAYLVSEDT